MNSKELAEHVTSGTTTPAKKVTVLWNHNGVALVKWPACTYWAGGFQNYVSSWVSLYHDGEYHRDVWDLGVDGRLTKGAISELIDKWGEA